MAHSAAPAWTDHNVHDPGITLLEALAYTMGVAALIARSVAAVGNRRHSREPDPT